MTNRFIDKLTSLVPLDDGDISALAAATAKSRSVPTRRDLIREGDRPGPVFVVLEGWACRYKILPNGTRQVLADSLGMTPVHLNRVLKKLRLSGAMTLKRGSLVIVDPLMLTEIAGFDENYLHRRLRLVA